MKKNRKITLEDIKRQRFASIFTDFGFKRAFGDEEDTRFLRKTIQILIKSKHEITEVSFDKNDVIGSTKSSRSARFDVFCRDSKGVEYIVEMQVTVLLRFIQRTKLYAFQRFNEMVEKGVNGFSNLKKIYVISFLDGKLFEGDELHHVVNLKNQHGLVIDDQIDYVFVEMGKWNKSEAELKSDFDKLMHFMKYTRTATIEQELPEYATHEEWFKGAMKKLKTANLSNKEYNFYMRELLEEAILKAEAQEKQEKIAQLENENTQVKLEVEQVKLKAEQAKFKAEQAKFKAEQAKLKLETTIVRLYEHGMDKEVILEMTSTDEIFFNNTLKKYGHLSEQKD